MCRIKNIVLFKKKNNKIKINKEVKKGDKEKQETLKEGNEEFIN